MSEPHSIASLIAAMPDDPDKGHTYRATHLPWMLEGWANGIAARYGHPVYIVGSAIEQGHEARDVDVVCVLPDIEFTNRFGSTWSPVSSWAEITSNGCDASPAARRWAAEVAKLSRWASEHHPLNIDFKVQSRSWVWCRDMQNKARVRIDSVPLEPEAFVFGTEA